MKRLCIATLLVSFSITVFASEDWAPPTSSVSSSPSVLSSFFSSILHRFVKNKVSDSSIVRVDVDAGQNTKNSNDNIKDFKEKKVTMDNFPVELEKKIILSVLLRQCYDNQSKRLKPDSISSDTFDNYIQSRLTQLAVPDEVYVAKRVEAKIYVQDALKQAQEKANQKNQSNVAEDELCSQAALRAHELILEKTSKDSQSSIDWEYYI